MFEGNLADLLIVESGNGNVYFVEDKANKRVDFKKPNLEFYEKTIKEQEEETESFHELKKEIKDEPLEDEEETPEYNYHPLSVYVEHHDDEEEIKSVKSEPIEEEIDEIKEVKKYRRKKRIKEKNKKTNLCKLCGAIKRKKAFSDHVCKHQVTIKTSKILYECDLCGNKITKYENLKYHMNIHLKIPYAVCNICGAQCFSPSGWKKHSCFRKIEQPNLKIIDTLYCRYCNNRFPSAMEKKCHKCDFQIDRFKKICRVCKKIISKNSFNHHMQTHSQEIHSCQVCGKEFNNKRCLKVHLQQHEATRRYKCDKCPESFVNKNTLEHHKRFHGEEASKRFTCDHCGKTLCSDFSLRGHIQRNHSTSKICEICKFEAANKALMKDHMKIHGTFNCTICNKSFALPRYLRAHERTHFEDTTPRVTCPVCFKGLLKWKIKSHVYRLHNEHFNDWQKMNPEF